MDDYRSQRRGSVRLASSRQAPQPRSPQPEKRAQRAPSRRSGAPARKEPFIVTLASSVIAAISDRVHPPTTRARTRRPSSRGGRGDQHLHNTFRSGSAAPTSNSIHSRGASYGLGRAPSTRGRAARTSSVIGQPLSASQRGGRPAGIGGAGRRGRSGYGRVEAVPIRVHSILLRGAVIGLVLFLVSSFISKPQAGIAPETESLMFDLPELTPTEFPISTPVSAWRQGEMPHLYQTDAQWATLPYGGDTVAKNACGPTALTMIYVYFTGSTDMDPGTMAQWADYNNYAPTGATEWSFMTEGAAAFGFYGEMINPTRANIESSLQNGHPVICVVDPGDFTDVGHYIVLKSIDERAMVEVYDPNSPERSARKWDIVRIINQTDVAWSYSSY